MHPSARGGDENGKFRVKHCIVIYPNKIGAVAFDDVISFSSNDIRSLEEVLIKAFMMFLLIHHRRWWMSRNQTIEFDHRFFEENDAIFRK